jgi:hypothetical protein
MTQGPQPHRPWPLVQGWLRAMMVDDMALELAA